jgi:hypothetical protein
MNVTAIVDFQCLLANKQHVIKELAVTQIDSPYSSHWIFTSELPGGNSKEISTNRWLTRRYHGLQPEYGEVDYTLLPKILQESTSRYSFLLVKGVEKQRILQRLLPSAQIYNMEVIHCPRFKDIKHLTNEKCIFHGSTNFVCAKTQAMSLKTWFNLNIVSCVKDLFE